MRHWPEAVFGVRPCLLARLSRRVGGFPRAFGFPLGGRDGFGSSAGCQGVQPGVGSGDLACPGPAFSEAEPQPAAAADDPSGDGEDPQPDPFGFPAGRRRRQRRASASRPAARRPVRRSRTRPGSAQSRAAAGYAARCPWHCGPRTASRLREGIDPLDTRYGRRVSCVPGRRRLLGQHERGGRYRAYHPRLDASCIQLCRRQGHDPHAES
jgi:hypothetical protein